MMQFRILAVILLFFLTSPFFVSCDPGRVYEYNAEIENSTWLHSDVKEFRFDIEDTSVLYNFLVNVRNRNNYAFSNLFILVEVQSPDNKYFSDTLELVLADKAGRWTGIGVGNVWQNQLSFFTGVKLLEKGKYHVKIRHGMRSDTLKAISDVGLRIEKYAKKNK